MSGTPVVWLTGYSAYRARAAACGEGGMTPVKKLLPPSSDIDTGSAMESPSSGYPDSSWKSSHGLCQMPCEDAPEGMDVQISIHKKATGIRGRNRFILQTYLFRPQVNKKNRITQINIE
ncbi:MAG: hypothetical protein NC095_07665 [Muribaculum sp.]|nr:hypothetical protein [Muribaculum sp.]